MYFFEDVCMPSDDEEISFYEDVLEFGVLNHYASIAIVLSQQQISLAAGAATSDDGLFQ